jgi:antitoxin ParD1/3/4
MPTQNVNLSEQQVQFIRKGIEEGRYRNASEVVRAGLRTLEQIERQDKLKLRALRRLAKQAFDGIDQGDFQVVDPDDLHEFVAKIDAKARASKS